jgi:hypothetical protein
MDDYIEEPEPAPTKQSFLTQPSGYTYELGGSDSEEEDMLPGR